MSAGEINVVQTLSVMDSFQLLFIGMELSQRVKREYLILHIHSHAFDMSQLRPRLNAEPCLGFEAILQGWRQATLYVARENGGLQKTSVPVCWMEAGR